MVNSVKDLYVDLNPFYLVGSLEFYKKYKEFIESVKRAVTKISLGNYLGMRFTFRIDGDFTTASPKLEEGETIYDSIYKSIEKISNRFEEHHTEFDYKFVDESNKIYSINGIAEKDNCRFIFQFTDLNQQIVDSSFMEMSGNQITRMVSLVFAKNENSAKRYIEKQMKRYEEYEGSYDPKIYDKRVFTMIANCLLLIAEAPKTSDFDYQIHSQFEVSFVRKLISINNEMYPIIKAPILMSKDLDQDKMLEEYTCSYSYEINNEINKIFTKLKEVNDHVPIVDLSTKQVLQMKKYVDKKVKDCGPVNFFEVLKNQKFGSIFKLNIDIENKNEGEIVCSIIKSDKYENFIIQILYTYNKKYDLLFHIFVKNGKEYTQLEEQIEYIESFIYFKDLNSMISSIVEYKDLLPEKLGEAKTLIILGKLFVSMFIMIADNPVKFGAAKEIRHTSTTVWKNRKPVEEKKEIVKHIIGFKSTLREKVKSQNADSSIKREVEYVLEKWERAGHYRNYKSGKQVWISKTDCHRHLDLTDKKVKITL